MRPRTSSKMVLRQRSRRLHLEHLVFSQLLPHLSYLQRQSQLPLHQLLLPHQMLLALLEVLPLALRETPPRQKTLVTLLYDFSWFYS